VYASGAVNVNQADPRVLLARLCSFIGIEQQPLCADSLQAARFVQLLATARSFVPVSIFSDRDDFLKFVEGGKGDAQNLYTLLATFLGKDNQLIFTPVVIPQAQRAEVQNSFIHSADIYTIKSIGEVGRVQVTVSAVVNFDSVWKPPAPNAGLMPGLGAFYHYRVY
jgi:hypothetical protein